MKTEMQKRIDQEKFVLTPDGFLFHYDKRQGKYYGYNKGSLNNAIMSKFNQILKRHC